MYAAIAFLQHRHQSLYPLNRKLRLKRTCSNTTNENTVNRLDSVHSQERGMLQASQKPLARFAARFFGKKLNKLES
jgi:hypothetical protein